MVRPVCVAGLHSSLLVSTNSQGEAWPLLTFQHSGPSHGPPCPVLPGEERVLGPLAHGVNPGTAGSSPSAEGGSQGHWVWSQQRIERASDHWPPVQKGRFTLHLTSLCLSGLDFAGRVVSPQSTAEGGGQPSPVPAQVGQDRAGRWCPHTPYPLALGTNCYYCHLGALAPGPSKSRLPPTPEGQRVPETEHVGTRSLRGQYWDFYSRVKAEHLTWAVGSRGASVLSQPTSHWASVSPLARSYQEVPEMGQEAQGHFWGPPWVTGGGWGISGDGGTGQRLGSAELEHWVSSLTPPCPAAAHRQRGSPPAHTCIWRRWGSSRLRKLNSHATRSDIPWWVRVGGHRPRGTCRPR